MNDYNNVFCGFTVIWVLLTVLVFIALDTITRVNRRGKK